MHWRDSHTTLIFIIFSFYVFFVCIILYINIYFINIIDDNNLHEIKHIYNEDHNNLNRT